MCRLGHIAVVAKHLVARWPALTLEFRDKTLGLLTDATALLRAIIIDMIKRKKLNMGFLTAGAERAAVCLIDLQAGSLSPLLVLYPHFVTISPIPCSCGFPVTFNILFAISNFHSPDPGKILPTPSGCIAACATVDLVDVALKNLITIGTNVPRHDLIIANSAMEGYAQ